MRIGGVVMSAQKFFTGPFAPLCEIFVAQRRAIGLKYVQQSRLLRQFDDFSKDFSVVNYTISEELALAWCRKRPNEKEVSRSSRIGEMQRFSVFLATQGYPSYLLPALPKSGNAHQPYIFTEDELSRIFKRLDNLQPTTASPIRHLSFPLLFRVLYGCGLRISELLNVQKGDIDVENGIIRIRCGKNDVERLAPMAESLAERMRVFIAECHCDTSDEVPLMYGKFFSKYEKSTISKAFTGFLWDAGIPYRGKDVGPRVHDIRHTFVCHNIKRWVEAGIPIHSKLPILSRYLGHTSISSTQWYLRLTADLYPHIREVCKREFGGMYTDIPNFKEVFEEDE
jgi:integrase